ncbi:hypothetical protein LSTR_LSTR009145 [Laodelphax striatellus]|uniref:Brinker DNA-binding domain-containing protein n=1 Tax=Laodelphax striatellus TaxID=195883 RepID=A0A482XUG5_LAOST|nr:hypothetical protein LSTR_LSTR009145 [Laodelphax striatellus]
MRGGTTRGLRLRSFTASEKVSVVHMAEEVGNREAGRRFDISEACIRDWKKKLNQLMGTNADRRAFRRRSSAVKEMEDDNG